MRGKENFEVQVIAVEAFLGAEAVQQPPTSKLTGIISFHSRNT